MSQEKFFTILANYVEHLKRQKTENLSRADNLGITDISLKTVTGLVLGLQNDMKLKFGYEIYKEFFLATNVILQSRTDQLARIIEIVNLIPELKLDIEGRGRFQPEQVAKIVVGWVNGMSIRGIAQSVRYDYKSVEEATGMCQRFINSNLRTYAPWGISIYQHLTNDEKTDNAKHLPSYIYYGVNDKESVILSKLGIPRFVVSRVKELYLKNFPGGKIKIKNIDTIKGQIKRFNADELSIGKEKGTTVKEIIDSCI